MIEVKTNVPTLRFPEFDRNWDFDKIENIADIKTGNKDTQNKVDDGLYPFFVRSDNVERINSYSYDGEAILTSGDGVGVGKNFHYIIGKFDYHQRVYCIHNFRSDYDGRFFYQYFSKSFYKRVIRLSAKNSVDSVRRDMITEMLVPCPTLPEQQKIADFLTAVDRKIQQLNRKKELLEQYKQGIMQQLFSQQLRFKDDDGNDFPVWEEKRLGEISEDVMYGMNSAAINYDGNHKYLRITDIDEDTRNFAPNPLTSPNGEIQEKFRLKEGDIVFARTGASVGKSYIYNKKDGNLYFAGFLIKFSIKNNNAYFIYLQTLRSSYSKWVNVMSMRSGQPGINAEEFKTLKILLPCIQEQNKIADFLSSIDAKITQTQTQIEKTQEFKKGLLQQMFV